MHVPVVCFNSVCKITLCFIFNIFLVLPGIANNFGLRIIIFWLICLEGELQDRESVRILFPYNTV
jgi:hypothetical protein